MSDMPEYEPTIFCGDCGSKISPRAEICPHCGIRQIGDVSQLWYLLPLFMGFIGGIVAYFAIRGKNSSKANDMLWYGLIMTIVTVIYFWR